MSDYIPPQIFNWDGEALIPQRPRLADKYYVVGETYRMAPYEERSMRGHRYYFACIRESWANLPEDMAERFPTSEHLRKYALIKAGFHDQRSIVAATKAEAQRVAAFVRPMDEYAVVTVSEAMVTTYTAKSQSVRAMGKKVFKESADAVLDVVAAMVGTSKAELAKNAGQAA